MKKTILSVLTLMLSLHSFAYNDNGINVEFPDINVQQGGTTEMVVTWNNEKDEIKGFQIEFTLPDGIHLVDAQIPESFANTNPELKVLSKDRRANNSTSIIGFQMSTTPFPQGETELLRLTIQADPTVAKGDYDISTSHLEFADMETGEACHLSPTGFHIKVGDVKEATGINNATVEESADAPCYDLSGRVATNSTRGIIISQGKKYVRPRR